MFINDDQNLSNEKKNLSEYFLTVPVPGGKEIPVVKVPGTQTDIPVHDIVKCYRCGSHTKTTYVLGAYQVWCSRNCDSGRYITFIDTSDTLKS